MSRESRADAQMGDGTSLVTLQRGYTEAVELDHKSDFLIAAMTTLVAAKQRLKDGETPDDDAVASLFALLRRVADDVEGIERDLLRCLKWDGEEVYTWQAIAEKSGGFYESRQAAQKRWSRLTDDARRTASRDMRRGAAIKGARTRAASVVDTMTTTVERQDG